MMTEDEKVAWRKIVSEVARRRRRRRLGPVVAVAVVGVVAGMSAAVARLDRPSETRLAAGPPEAGVIGVTGDPRSVAGGPIPSLETLFNLPTCTTGSAELRAWMSGALAPYLVVDSTSRPTTVGTVAQAVPVIRDQPPAGACTLAIVAGDAQGWELRGGDGQLLGRGAGTAVDGAAVPPRLTGGDPGLYHQEWLASGQPFSGIIDGSRVDGVGAGRGMVLEVPSVPTAAGSHYAAGVQVLARLTLASVAPLDAQAAFRLPVTAPAGFSRCTGDLASLVAGSYAVEFCDRSGRTITVSWSTGSLDRVAGRRIDISGRPVDIAGLPAKVVSESGLNVILLVDLVIEDGPDMYVEARAFPGADTDGLIEMVGSIPALDPRVLHPHTGSGDLRTILTDDSRLRSILEAAGATDLNIPPKESCPRSPESAVPTTIVLPCPLPDPVSFTLPGGSSANLVIAEAEGQETLLPSLPQTTRVESVAGIDVVERETAGTAVARNSAQQSTFVCGRVRFNLIGNEVFSFTRVLIPTLAC